MNKKILLITQIFYPDEVSTANLFTNLCSVLAEDNINVEVWCAQPSYTTLKRQPSVIQYNNINICYLSSTNFHKKKLIGRLLNYLTFSLSLTLKLLRSKNNSVIFTHTNPPSLGILIAMVLQLKGKKFIYILLDIFPDGLCHLGKLSFSNPIVKIWQKLFRFALHRSEKIIVIGRDMKEWLISFYKPSVTKVQYIPHWQDSNLIKPIPYEDNAFVREHNLEGKFVVQYSGNMGLWQDMKVLGATAKKMESENINFVFIGDGIRKEELLGSFEGNIPDNVILLPFQPNSKLGSALTACHIALLSLREGLTGMAVPSKIYGILASGVPCIALVPNDSEIAMVLNEEKCGIVVKPGDTNGLVNAILKLKNDNELRKKMGENGRIAFEKKYTTKVIANKYKEIILNLGDAKVE